MAICKRFQAIRSPGLRPLKNNLRRHVLVPPGNHEQRRAIGYCDLNARLRLAQYLT